MQESKILLYKCYCATRPIRDGNPYEIGAKIINLGNLMTELTKINLEKIKEYNQTADSPLPFSYAQALNCKSGKDRSGNMDCIAKAYHALYIQYGKFPSHQDLQDPVIQKRFANYLLAFLINSGSMEVTRLNTGAHGYKISDIANIAGLPPTAFLGLVGLSGTTDDA